MHWNGYSRTEGRTRRWLASLDNSVLVMCFRHYRSLEIQGEETVSHSAEEKEEYGPNKPLTSSQGADPLRVGH